MPMFDTIHAYIFLKTCRLFIKTRRFFTQIWRESGRIPVYFASNSRFSYFFTPNTPVFLLFFHPKTDVFDLTKCQEIYPISNGIYFSSFLCKNRRIIFFQAMPLLLSFCKTSTSRESHKTQQTLTEVRTAEFQDT